MAEEHIYDRYTKANKAAADAHNEVQRLVAKVQEIGQKLHNWRNVGFTGTLQDGTYITADRSPVVRLDELPTVEQIRESILKWHHADIAVNGAIQAMTLEQRQTLGLEVGMQRQTSDALDRTLEQFRGE